MKLVVALVAALVAAVAVAGAHANGSPYTPGLVHGAGGVVSPGEGVRYVTFATPRSTTVAAIRTRDGRVVRTRRIRGSFGIPLVAYDGTAGGLSGNGQRLVLATYGPLPGSPGQTRFVVLETRSLRLQRVTDLRGSWSFDAISPDGSTLYLTEHVSAGAHPVYRVRSYDVDDGRLGAPSVAPLESEDEMGGEPVTRAVSPSGRWAYTLYARRGHEPFVHALDTGRRQAFCVDLPLDLGYEGQWSLRLRLRGGELAVRAGRRAVATIDTRSWRVETRR